MRSVVIVPIALLVLAPVSALDWTGRGEYGSIAKECREAVERAAIWWFIEDRWKSDVEGAYPVLFTAERMGLLPDRVPVGVPVWERPTVGVPRLRSTLLMYPHTVDDVRNLKGPLLHEVVYQDVTPAPGDVEVQKYVRDAILGLVHGQNEDGSWGEWREEWPEETARAVGLLLRVLEYGDVVSHRLGLGKGDLESARKAVERGVAWLLEHQGDDGRFDDDPSDHALVISTLIDVYLLADRLGLDVDRNKVLDAIRKGIEWLFTDAAGVRWVNVGGSHGPVWPGVRATGDALRFALLKALWYDVAADAEIETPAGKRRLSDLLTDPGYNLHATVRRLLEEQIAEKGPDYGGWPGGPRAVAAAMGALEAYLNPRLYYGEYWKPANVRVETEVADVTGDGTVVTLRYRVARDDVEGLRLTVREDYGFHGSFEVWSGELEPGGGTLTFEFEGHTLYVFRVLARYADGTVDDVFSIAGLRAICDVNDVEVSDGTVRVEGRVDAILVSGGSTSALEARSVHVVLYRDGEPVAERDVPVDERGRFTATFEVGEGGRYRAEGTKVMIVWKDRPLTVTETWHDPKPAPLIGVIKGPRKPPEGTEGSGGHGAEGGTEHREHGGEHGTSPGAPHEERESEGGTTVKTPESTGENEGSEKTGTPGGARGKEREHREVTPGPGARTGEPGKKGESAPSPGTERAPARGTEGKPAGARKTRRFPVCPVIPVVPRRRART
ncbi:hypothetical protein [Methanopyrus sp.]